MYKKITILTITFALALFSKTIHSQKVKDAKMKVSCSEPDAAIYVNGRPSGNGAADVKILANSCITISAKKEGKFAKGVEYCNNGLTKIPKAYYIQLDNDAAYEASVKTDIANVDINLRLKKSQAESWKAVNNVILQYFDAIEVSDKENFYLRTAWVANDFPSGLIRTRVVIKSNGDDQFLIKIISEHPKEGLKLAPGVKDDEKFEPWDRVLRKYANIIEELQNRL